MAGFANFAGVNPNFFFQSGPYPGASAFDNALKQYQSSLKMAPQQGQLAAGQAASAPAQAYAGQKASPTGSGDAFARGTFANLMGGMEKSRTAGRAATSSAQMGAIGGAEDVAGAYGSSIEGQLRGQLAEKQASQNTEMGGLEDIIQAGKLGTGIASEVIAPGNPFGAQMAFSGLQGLAGGGGSPGGFYGSNGGPFSMMGPSSTPFGSAYTPGTY